MANFQELITNGTQVNALNTDLYAWTDVSSFKWFSLQINGTWTATFTYQLSNDALNPLSGTMYSSLPANITFSSTFASNNIFVAPIISRYIRFRATAFTSNTSLSAVLELYETPPPTFDLYAVQSGVWSVGLSTGTLNVGNVGTLAYPINSTPQNNSAQATNAAATATLTGVGAKSTYLGGFDYSMSAVPAAATTLTVTGVTNGPLTYEIPVLLTGPQNIQFNPPLQSSAVNTNIVVSLGALGAAVVGSVNARGYTL